MNTRAHRLRELMGGERWLAHERVFAERHGDAGAVWHRDLAGDFWSAERRLVILGFRGGGKSTYAEEYVCLGALEKAFRFAVFIGPSESRAAERLGAVAAELKLNEVLPVIYPGRCALRVDTQTKIELVGGPVIVAMGRGQDIRGLKAGSDRPDLVIVDDFEDAENVLTPEGRKRMLRWFLRELRLACHPQARWRVLATVMDRDCVPLQLVRAGWPVKRYPLEVRDRQGSLRPAWPSRFPAAWVAEEKLEYQRHGEAAIWEMEMMCEDGGAAGADDFRPEHFPVVPRVRVWEPVWVMVDPARSGRRGGRGASATGIVVFSWVGRKLVVWEDRTGFYRPSEIIEIMFELDEKYRPVFIGFEEVGLEEWGMEPLRAEMVRRGRVLPLKPLRAPRDKLAFIRGLEPHARGGEIELAQPMVDLVGAFVGFPRGQIDGPNALAYARVLRPGLPVYEDFDATSHVAERPYVADGAALMLALGADGRMVAGGLLAVGRGRVAVLGDWVEEGDAGWAVPVIAGSAGFLARAQFEAVLGPRHFDEWHNFGLLQAVRAIPLDVRQGGDARKGQKWLRELLVKRERGVAAVQVAEAARWTLGALSGGYARRPLAAEPESGAYRLLMEAVEAALGLQALGLMDDDEVNWSFTPDGRRYRRYASAFAQRMQ